MSKSCVPESHDRLKPVSFALRHTITGERVRSGRGSLTRPLLLAAVVLAVPAAGFAVCWAAARAVVE